MSAALASPAHEGIQIRNAYFRYPRAEVLSNASFELERGATCVITGANGCGKSTLLYLCAGLLALRAGSVFLGGRRPDPHHTGDLFRRGIHTGFVFQEGGLLSNMNALANVALPLRYHQDVFGITLAEVEKRARGALERVGLSRDEMYELPAHLSFGVRKRIAVARAIAVSPNFFFFDDPDVGLDPKTAELVHEILCEYRDNGGVTMMVATNRELLIDRLGVPGFVLSGGQIRPKQAAATLPQPPRIA